jgi:ubiquinone/menaquinone biosynthesis C-methylase UbiE
MSTEQPYIGQELTIFAHAKNWKQYYASIIRPYFGKRVVEAGAGLGATTLELCDGTQEEWICLEPDSALRSGIDRLIAEGKLPHCCQTRGGFVSNIPTEQEFDTFIYIDVLEHIEDDRAELQEASSRLSPGGRLIVLSPAFNFLYSPFDKSIGHFRRYNRKMYEALTPAECRIEKMMYLDSVGVGTSLVNRMFLSQPMPTINQILFWDRRIIPFAKLVDWLLRYSFGRSLLGIWVKQ